MTTDTITVANAYQCLVITGKM